MHELRSRTRSAIAHAAVAVAVGFGYRPRRALEDHPVAVPATVSSGADRFWRELAIQDWIVLLYLVTLLLCAIAGEGPRRRAAIAYVAVDLAVFFGALVATRTHAIRGTLGAIVYRAGLFVGVFGSFSHLQYVLPTARSTAVDASLYRLDLAVFGIEPAEALDRFVTPATTEWFSFFYFSYFFILAVHVLPFMFGARRLTLLAEFSLGVVAIFCIGHVLYIVVPGHGPYHHLADRFAHPLDGPVWWRLVRATVDSVDVGARTDIFPSLHTAIPTYLALFAVRQRRGTPFRFAWPLLAVFASQIVISTMFLRWHYLADVIAGLGLAGAVASVDHRIVAWEETRRRERGRSPVWTALLEAPAGSRPELARAAREI